MLKNLKINFDDIDIIHPVHWNNNVPNGT